MLGQARRPFLKWKSQNLTGDKPPRPRAIPWTTLASWAVRALQQQRKQPVKRDRDPRQAQEKTT